MCYIFDCNDCCSRNYEEKCVIKGLTILKGAVDPESRSFLIDKVGISTKIPDIILFNMVKVSRNFLKIIRYHCTKISFFDCDHTE